MGIIYYYKILIHLDLSMHSKINIYFLDAEENIFYAMLRTFNIRLQDITEMPHILALWIETARNVFQVLLNIF